jgi:hypothetical protein
VEVFGDSTTGRNFLRILMGFTKLDERIVQSSIMLESPETFKIWITLLALCKEDGIAECSPVYLESVCRIPIDKVVESIKKLSSPDELSRSINDDGARIRRVDGGFEIINYIKYRTESLKSAEAERKRLYRQKEKCPDTSGRCPDTSASVSASVSASEEGMQGEDHVADAGKMMTTCMRRKKRVPATRHGENVLLADGEYDQLVNDLGKQVADAAIASYDGKFPNSAAIRKHTDHNLGIRDYYNRGFLCVKPDQTTSQPTTPVQKPYPQNSVMMARIVGHWRKKEPLWDIPCDLMDTAVMKKLYDETFPRWRK